MNRACATVAWFAIAGVAAASPAPVRDAKLIGEGLMEGFLSDQPDLKKCVGTAVTAFRDLDQAVHLLEKNNTVDTLRALRDVAEAFNDIPQIMRSCKALERDVEDIIDALRQIHSPVQFAFKVGKNLVVNHHDIYQEMRAAVADYRGMRFLDFGVQFGTALRKLTVGEVDVLFEQFVAANGATYASDEARSTALAAFAENLVHIHRLRKNEEDGGATYSHLSPFADLSPEDFRVRLGFRPEGWVAQPESELEALDTLALPGSFDWREKGAVNSVKDQKQCGSCWAFATVANIEGALFASSRRLLSLSEQELVDCDDKTGDEGCNGGLPANAYKDMIQNNIGLELEADYPYKARGGACAAKRAKEAVFIRSAIQISKNEDQIAAALVKYGPLAIGINAGPMQLYHGGVAHPSSLLCSPKRLDHGVALVGFGVDDSVRTTPYWIIRNSWGPRWGEKGYYRIVRGKGACGLNTMVTTATGVHVQTVAVDAAESAFIV